MSTFMEIAYFTVVYVISNTLLRLLQSIMWLLYGPRQNDLVEYSVQEYDVVADMKPKYAITNDKSFLLHKFREIKDVSCLENEHVTLYSVTEDEFVFVRTSPEVDIFNTEQHPFIYDIQHSAAEQLLTASHATVFKYLASKPARDGSNIAYLHSHGRCGSTLVAAMMFKTKQCVVLSEPTPVLNLALMFNSKDYPASRRSKEYVDLVRATFLLLCPDPEKLYFIKPWPIQTLSLLPLIHQALPGVKESFMYRAIRPTVLSFKKLMGLLDPSGNRFESDGNRLISVHPVNYRKIWDKIGQGRGDEAWCFVVLSQIHAYLLETRDRDDIRSYSYESLLENKEGFTRSLLRDTGVGVEHVEAAMSALERDSQANALHNKSKARVTQVSASIPDSALEWAVQIARNEFQIEMEGEEGRILNMPHTWTDK